MGTLKINRTEKVEEQPSSYIKQQEVNKEPTLFKNKTANKILIIVGAVIVLAIIAAVVFVNVNWV